MTRGRFDREFKLRAVELSFQRDNMRELAHELGVRPEMLYRWRSEFGTLNGGSFPGNGKKKMTVEESELARLKKELQDVRIERDILKKAVGIFSKSDGRFTNS
jgi:transposase